AVGGADVDAVAGDDGRAVDSALRGEGPLLRAFLAIEGVNALVAAADYHHLVRHGRRRIERLRLLRLEGPGQLRFVHVHRLDLVGHRADVESAVDERRRGARLPFQIDLGERLAGLDV